MDWLKTVAPTVATALGGPLAGLAVEAIGSAFGWTDATKEKVESVLASGQLTGEQMLQLKQAEIALKQRQEELGFQFEELTFKDRDSAREREAAVKDNTNKILAYIVVGAFITMVASILMGWSKAESVMAGTLVGYLSAKAEQVLAYYFGSTKGSADKTAIIARQQPK